MINCAKKFELVHCSKVFGSFDRARRSSSGFQLKFHVFFFFGCCCCSPFQKVAEGKPFVVLNASNFPGNLISLVMLGAVSNANRHARCCCLGGFCHLCKEHATPLDLFRQKKKKKKKSHQLCSACKYGTYNSV